MAGLLQAIGAIVLMALIIGTGAERTGINKRHNTGTDGNPTQDVLGWICQNFPGILSDCSTTSSPTGTSTASPTSTTYDIIGDIMNGTSSFEMSTTTKNPLDSTTASPGQLANWCCLTNGTCLSLGRIFMQSSCGLCQCTTSHAIMCTTLQCMSTFCIDSSQPSPGLGQCCPQCPYEKPANSCVYKDITFPHGTIITTLANNVRCWCELGTVECRQYSPAIFSGLDVWGNGTAVYVIIVIVFILLSIGTLLCCGCTLFFYYYYKYNQGAIQQVYEQYWNSSGWQPMTDESKVLDDSDIQKHAEMEKNQYEDEYPMGNLEAHVPPPYALYNGSYVNDETVKDQKLA